jgi:hypothetical protein
MKATTITSTASHLAMLAKPGEVAALIEKAAVDQLSSKFTIALGFDFQRRLSKCKRAKQ